MTKKPDLHIKKLITKLKEAAINNDDNLLLQLMEQAINERSRTVWNLLDNVGQGLLTFGKDGVIHSDYSYECKRIFGEGIETKTYPLLIYPDNKEDQLFIERLLKELFSCKEQYKAEVYLSLLPNEITSKGMIISLEYKLIDSELPATGKAVLVVVTEVTEKRKLESKVQRDAQIMRMVANVAGNFSGFVECVKEFQYFYGSKLHEIVAENTSASAIYADVFREIHTFKGSFSQYEMQSSVDNLNSMENALTYIGGMLDTLSRKDLCAFIYSFDIIDFLSNDLDILSEKLGSHFLSRGEMLNIDKQKLSQLEEEIISICSPTECSTLLPLIKQLKFKSLKELLSNYPDYTRKLAERLDKPINSFLISGDDLLVDSEKYGHFIKALVHVFRNCVDHGLERADIRLQQGKSVEGNICCSISINKDLLEISIEDDGYGIDFEKIRKKAEQIGISNFINHEKMEENYLIDLIFTDGFTTKERFTDVSGRGMGLSTVKAEVEKLGGRVEVYTAKDKGTKFRFLIPISDATQVETLTVDAFKQSLLVTTMDFLKEHGREALNIKAIIPFNSVSLEMSNYTAFISIKGLFEGLFAISVDENMSKVLLQSMVHKVIMDQYESKYIKDVIAECANIILGNSINSNPNIQEMIRIGTPNIICSASSDASYEGNDINAFKIITDRGSLIISIIH